MILRIRLPSGATHRVNISPSSTLADLAALIEPLNAVSGQFSLHSDPTFTSEFKVQTASNGDMVYVRGARPPEPESSKKEPVKIEQSSEAEDGEWKPRCRHGPRGMCESCMPREDKKERYENEVKKWKGRGMSVAVMEAMEALKFKIVAQEEAHITAADIDSDAAQEFQAYLARTGFSQQRVGICYGELDEDSGETKVLAIYEPPQQGGEEQYKMVDGEEAGDMTERADALAGMLGMKEVGVVFSARPRKCLLSGSDVVFAAKLMSGMSREERKGFVVLVVSMAETGETLFEAYQISDLAVEMFDGGIFEEESKQKANSGKALCKEEVLVEGKETKKVHTEFFLINVPIKSCESWLRTKFAIENRDIAPQGTNDIKKVIEDSSVPYHRRLSDFHALLFLSNTFDINSDMPGLAAVIKAQSDDIGEGYRLMIDGMASS